MHYYKRNLGDYAKKAGRLSMLQHGSYTLLIDACYDREQFPTLEEAIEWTWASSTAEIEAVEFVLRKFFTLEDGVYVQKRIQEELAEYRIKAETNKRIATERETNRKAKSTNRAPDVNEPPPNHKPITNNHKPVTNTKPKSAPATPLPDWLQAGSWNDYLETRKVLKAPMTDRAKLLAIAKLHELRQSGHDPTAVLNQSIYNGWKGLFPIKADTTTDKGQTRHEQLADKLADLTGQNRRNKPGPEGVIHGYAERVD
jgi:uncharacterized protein YdaU (DUF1376 family)